MATSPVSNKVDNILPQDIPSHSLSSRVSSRATKNYSYSDSFETSSYKQETEDWDYLTASSKQKDNYSKTDYKDDSVSYLDTFESESSISSYKSFKQIYESGTDTKSQSLSSSSGPLDKRTIFDISEFNLFEDLSEKPDKIRSKSLDSDIRLEGEITSEKEKLKQKISQHSTKEEKEKELFIKKCLQRIRDPQNTCDQRSFEYDDCLKQFLDTFTIIISEKNVQDSNVIPKRETKSRSEIEREDLLKSPFKASPSLLAKIRMKNLMSTMDEASAVRIHNPQKCKICSTKGKKIDASLARERFIKCKVNDLTRKKVEIKIEDHLIEMASLCL